MVRPYDKLSFLDEYGDTSLAVEKSGVTTHYIIAAIVLNTENVELIRDALTHISDKYFSGGEVKSSSIGKKDARRIAILEKLADLPFHAHVQSVDKSRLSKTSGLIYKRSFIKYLHGKLYDRLFKAFPSLSLTIDEHGSKEFMKGFVKYVHENHIQSDLFSSYSIGFERSSVEPILQLADLVAGSLARVFDPKKLSPNAHRILELLGERVMTLEHWPPRMRGFRASPRESGDLDDKVELLSRRSALKYLETNYHETYPDIVLRVEVLRYLLYRLDVQSTGTYVSTHSILDAVEEITENEISDTSLRANVIGPLRDAGILIVSGASGYKIADSTEDVRRFVGEVDRRVSPQLKRIGMMRDMVRSTTMDELDIFEGEYSYLADAVAAVRGSK